MSDPIFLVFTILLGLAGTAFFGYYTYKLDKTPEIKNKRRMFNRGLLALGILFFVVGLALSLLATGTLADWGLVLGLSAIASVMFLLAAQGFGVGFQQMDEDGIGFIRFFQLGSAIIICLAFVPAFIAFVTYNSRLAG